ncbi:hemolysin family protein [uncultured Ruthenibacterium sp.]|uniref:hemolysin family protein n=1 Tax=uncultured Ruthenibacterium sp. TaxID=1905347 RepID=UPI00349EF3D5
MDIGRQLLLQAVLIFFNAFFAMTEIAVISLNPAKLRRMAEEGDTKAGRLLKMVETPAGFLSTIQIGITLAGFLGSAFAADSFSEYLVDWVYDDLGFTALPPSALDALAVIFITVILSYFTLILGELVPKRIAMQKPMQVARFTCGVVYGLSVVMRPVIWFLSASTNGVLRLLHMKVEAEEESVTEEEIRLMMDLGEEKGAIEKEEKQWIENVFDFGDAIASDAMTHAADVEAVCITDSDAEILELIRRTGRTRFPVYGEDLNDVVGLLNARDFLIHLSTCDGKSLTDMLRPAYFVPESIRCSVLFGDMQQKKIHLAVVVDEYGETAGIITMEDLLEEIVGNIYDEFDPAEPDQIRQLEENLWQMSGSVSMEDVAEAVGLELPDELDYDTLGGMVFSCLHTIPQDGTPLDVECLGLHVHVDEVRERRIQQAKVSRVVPAAPKE